MADKFTGERDVNIVRSHDEADGSFSDAVAAHNRGWDATDGAWNRLPVDHATGALKVYTSGSGVAGGGAATIADGADVAEGVTSDAAVVTDVAGTVSGKMRGLVKWAFERMPASLGQKAMSASLPVVLASDQASVPVAATLAAETTKVIGTVNQAALTKGTQGANGVSTQDLKDSGRVNIALTAEFAFAQTGETLLTITESRAGAATGSFTSKTITSGKRIRFTGGFAIIETLGTGTTVPQRMYLRLRVNTAGATTATSALQYVWGLGIATGSAAIPVKASTSAPFDIPDGVEYAGDGTATYGLTLETPDWVITTGTGRCKITLFAFEY